MQVWQCQTRSICKWSSLGKSYAEEIRTIDIIATKASRGRHEEHIMALSIRLHVHSCGIIYAYKNCKAITLDSRGSMEHPLDLSLKVEHN